MSGKTKTTNTASDTVSSLKTKVEKSLEKAEKTENLVYLGFVVLIAMFATLALSHLDLIRSGLEKDKDMSDLRQEYEMKILKKCLDASRWLNPKCLES